MGNKRKAILVDVDGTMCNQKRRWSAATKEEGKIDWDKYFDKELLMKDPLNVDLKKKLLKYKDEGLKIIFLTGRMEELREITMKYLDKHEVPIDLLVMRENDDYAEIENYKEGQVKKLQKFFDFQIAYEDLDEGIQALNNCNVKNVQVNLEK